MGRWRKTDCSAIGWQLYGLVGEKPTVLVSGGSCMDLTHSATGAASGVSCMDWLHLDVGMSLTVTHHGPSINESCHEKTKILVSDTNQDVQLQKMARDLKFRI